MLLWLFIVILFRKYRKYTKRTPKQEKREKKVKRPSKPKIHEETQIPQHNQPTKLRDHYITSRAFLPCPG
jgi:hypothetical protein